MILRTEDIKSLCAKISTAIDTADVVSMTDILQLKSDGSYLYLSITNKEYYVKAKLSLSENIDFHATVSATLFLKLISSITTETIEFDINDNTLMVKGNGTYKFPLIYDGDKILELPVIDIGNPTVNIDIMNNILQSILTYNSKELTKGVAANIVQNYYYIDEQGAITFRKGACVNKFSLSSPMRVLLTNKIVKLFKLLKDDKVKFTLGYDAISNDIIQTKVRFETSDIILTAITSCDDTLLNTVPVNAIRNRAYGINYKYNITLNKDLLLDAIKRLSLFSINDISKIYGKFIFKPNEIIICDYNNENSEVICYASKLEDMDYTAAFDFNDIKTALDKCNSSFVNMSFGDSSAAVISHNDIYHVIPEIIQ